MPCASFSMLENDAHDIEKLLLINSSKLNKFLHSEVNLLIQHIIVLDQDGQNNHSIKFESIFLEND